MTLLRLKMKMQLPVLCEILYLHYLERSFLTQSFGSRITESLFDNIDEITATIIVDEIRESIEIMNQE